jgi:enamine deaminase RidA (YjgF/YER057c/UK114 family)
VYGALHHALTDAGAKTADVVSESAFVRDAAMDLDGPRAYAFETGHYRAAVTKIGQSPLAAHAHIEVSMQAVVGNTAADVVRADDACGLRLRIGPQTRLYAAGLGVSTGDASAQTSAAFASANGLLQAAGMTFTNVARTWLHLPDIDRDYAALNVSRRQFFAQHGITSAPASTGIGGTLPSESCRLGLGFYAVSGDARRTIMTSPTLNEAPQYGADFVRGLRLDEGNRTALMVSGTASIDEHGASVHLNNTAAQAERMLLNIRALLERQGAGFEHIVSAVSYIKHAEDAGDVQRAFAQAGFEGFPNALVVADVCRPELKCETEVLALLPPVTNDA